MKKTRTNTKYEKVMPINTPEREKQYKSANALIYYAEHNKEHGEVNIFIKFSPNGMYRPLETITEEQFKEWYEKI